MIKKITLMVIGLLVSASTFAQTCGNEGQVIALTSQNAVDNFKSKYGDCTQILGTLYITGAVTNLKGLSGIKKIEGKFQVYKSELRDLSGLESLESVGGVFSIGSNENLKSLKGISNLKEIGDFLLIGGNTALENIDDLKSVKKVGGYLQITNNEKLKDLKGLNSVESFGKYLYIINNAALQSLMTSNNLKSINGFIEIRVNPLLTAVTGFDKLDVKGIKNLVIANNDVLNVCNNPVFNKYLSVDANTATIVKNAEGCNSREMVLSLAK